MRGFCVVLMLAAWLPATAWALTLDEIDLGEQIRGPIPRLTTKDFTGKVVLVDLWGIQCGPCIAQMPELQEYYKKYRFDGFHIVAMERQGKTNGEAFEFFANNPLFNGPTLEFQFTYTGRSVIPGRHIPELPANFLFNGDGYLIGSNLHGPVLEAKIKEALGDSLATITAPGNIGRLASFEARLKSGQDIMLTLSDLVRKKRDTPDPKVLDEATRLFSGVFDWANKKYDRAMLDKERTPMAALMSLKTIVRTLPGTDVGERSARVVEELSKDIRIVREEKADKELHRIITQISDLKPTPAGNSDPNDPEFRKLNFQALRTLSADCQKLQYVFANTEAADHTQVIVDDFRLKEKDLN